MKRLFLPLLCYSLAAGQTTGTTGSIVEPSGDKTLTNIIIGSAVTPSGTFGYTAEVYLVKSDGSAPPQQLTHFDESNDAPGASWVAISSDGTRAAYVGKIDTKGVRHEEVHTIDLISGSDVLIAQYPGIGTCDGLSCIGPVALSQDGTKVVWASATIDNSTIYSANFDGTDMLQLGFDYASIPGPNNVTTSDGRFIFGSSCGEFCERIATANFDGTGLAGIAIQTNVVNGGLGDPVISTSGNATANIAWGYTPSHQTMLYSVDLTPGGCTLPPHSFFASFSSLTISGDGSRAAGVSEGQIFSCEIAVTPLNELYAMDVQLSGDGTRMIYSVGLNNAAHRAAVWISDANGANAGPVFAPRSINPGGIVGLGSYGSNILPLSPGSYFTIYGTGLSDVDAVLTPELPFPVSLDGLSVMVNGTPVPVQAVTPWQINALLPQEIAPGNFTITTRLPDGTQLSQAVTAAPTAAAIDLVYDVGFSSNQAVACHPGTTTLADGLHPAAAGEILETYGFGLGVTSPYVAAGTASPSNPPATAAMPFVNFDGVLAQTTFAGLVPGLAGLYQVNVVVPAGLPPGKHVMHWYTATGTSGAQGVVFTQ